MRDSHAYYNVNNSPEDYHSSQLKDEAYWEEPAGLPNPWPQTAEEKAEARKMDKERKEMMEWG